MYFHFLVPNWNIISKEKLKVKTGTKSQIFEKFEKKETSLPSLSAVSIAYVLIFIFVSYKQTNLSDLFNVKCSPLMVEP